MIDNTKSYIVKTIELREEKKEEKKTHSTMIKDKLIFKKMKIPFVGRNDIMILQSITHLVILSCFFLAGRSGIFLFIWRTKS